MGGTGAITGVSVRTSGSLAVAPRWRAFQRSRASRCSSGESCARCRSQMNPARGPRERFGQPSTRQLMSSVRRGRGALGGRRTMRCAGTAVGSFPSAASRLFRSRILFCSGAESFLAWSRQNQRLRGPAPGSPQPGTGQSRPARRPSTSTRPAEARVTASLTWCCTSSPIATLRSCANRSMSVRKEASLFRWAMIVAFVCAGEMETGSVLSGGGAKRERNRRRRFSSTAEQAFELVRSLLLGLVRLLLRLLFQLLLLLLRALLPLLLLLIGGPAEDPRDEARAGGLHVCLHRSLAVEVGDARARRRPHQAQPDGNVGAQLHATAGELLHGRGRERDDSGHVERAVQPGTAGEAQLRLRRGGLERLLQVRPPVLDGDPEGKIFAQVGRATLRDLSAQRSGQGAQ